MVKREPKYFGDDPDAVSSDPQKVFPKATIISAEELNRVQQQLNGMQVSDTRRKYLEEEKVKNWENTVHGQRRKRLLARELRLEEEEARRVEQDKEYEMHVQEQRNASIDRANMLMYNELDHVKQFHSRLLTHQILKERDLQLEYKKKQRELQEKHIGHLLPMNDIFGESQIRAIKEKEVKEHHIECAKEQKKKWEETEKLKKEQIKKELEEGKAIVQKDMEDYRYHKNIRQEKKKVAQKEFLKNLISAKEEVKTMTEQEKQNDKIYEVKINAWKQHKENLMLKKKKIEEERFQEMLKIREQMGERQALILQKAAEKTLTGIEKAAKQARIKEEILEREKKERQLKSLAEIKKHRELKAKERVLNAELEKKEEKKLLQQYRSEAENFEQGINQKKQKAREAALHLQDYHKSQIAFAGRVKSDIKQETLAFHKEQQRHLENEKKRFQEYVKGIPNELWIVSGEDKSKLANFIARDEKHFIDAIGSDGSISGGGGKVAIPQYSVAQTAERLGFGVIHQSSSSENQKEPLVGILTGN